MLTRKQHELLMYIHERIKETGVSPSFDEMKDALDLASKSGIHRLITALEERGFLRRLPHRARALEVTKLPEQATAAAYLHATMFTSQVLEDYSDALAEVTPLENPRFFYLDSGSEAVETALKFARQVQVDRGETQRYMVISRWQSYHGTTLGALAVSGRPARRFPQRSGSAHCLASVASPCATRCATWRSTDCCGASMAVAPSCAARRWSPARAS